MAKKKSIHDQSVISKIVGEDVPHAHIWIYPNPETAGDKKDFEGNVEKIKENL